MTPEMDAFYRALRGWLIAHWRPQERFNGEFDVAIFLNEAVPWRNPELSAALDAVLPGKKRYKGTWRRGCHYTQSVITALRPLVKSGQLKLRGTFEHGWYSIP